MGSRLENLKATSSKTRLIFVLTFVVLIFGGAISWAVIHRNNTYGQTQAEIKMGAAPNISSVPGELKNPKYAEALSNSNENKFKESEAKGGTSLPTPAKLADNSKILGSQTETNLGTQFKTTTDQVNQKVQDNVVQPIKNQFQQTQQPIAYQTGQNTIQSLGLAKQVDVLLESWRPSGMSLETDFTSSSKTLTSGLSGSNTPNLSVKSPVNEGQLNSSSSSQKKPTLVRAGKIAIGFLKTSINTDEPGPILAEIANGPLKGATLIGSMTAVNLTNSQKVAMQFNILNPPNSEKSIRIQAFAINPESSGNGFADDVDHHYLQRVGLLFASAFISGYGQAVSQSGATITQNPLGGSTSAISSRTVGQEALIGLGNVGTVLGNSLGQLTNRPITVKVNAGTTVGILFMQDVTEDGLPEQIQQTVNQTQKSDLSPGFSTGQSNTQLNANNLNNSNNGVSSNLLNPINPTTGLNNGMAGSINQPQNLQNQIQMLQNQSNLK